MSDTIFAGRTLILGIGGGIAAYKMGELASRLTQLGAVVQVILTQNAMQFVTPLTFAALTGQPVHTSLWPQDYSTTSGAMASMAHIDLARHADAMLIAPATANLLAKLATGAADDLLTTLALATTAPVLVAPSMNPTMLRHPATQRNVQQIKEWGYRVIDPASGRTACQEVGSGRLPDTKVLLAALENALQNGFPQERILENRTVLITAGPTREALDPVRFLGNRSSGKMGYALAEAAATKGAKVLLVSGPVQLSAPPGVELFPVITTGEMHEVAVSLASRSDIVIAAAAPADYRPAEVASNKIKKKGTAPLQLELVPTPDIIAEVGQRKTAHQVVIGFAAETENVLENACRKLVQKNLDAIVLNDVTKPDAGFESETNEVTWLTAQEQESWPLMSKCDVANQILQRAADLWTAKQRA